MKKSLLRACEAIPPRISAVLLAVGLFAIGPAKAQVVTFPDPSLEAAVRNTLQIYSPTNIYRTNMLVLTNLYSPYGSIQNLTGLETASNLLTLDLGFNQLTNLSPLAGLTKLTQLHAGWNPLTNCAPLAGLTNLTYLDLNSDQLTNISPLGGLRKLGQLMVPWNHVLDASPVAGLTNLFWLDIGGNRGPLDSSITNVTALTGLKHLQWLSLYYLRVSDLSPLTGLTTLTNLDVSWNSAPTNLIALNGLTNLLLLHVTADSLSNIVFVSHLPRLQDLDFGNNSVNDLSPALGRNLTSLQAYYNNPLTNASLVTNFHQLAHLSLGGDGLTNLSFLGTLTNLQELWIDGNPNVASITPILGLTNLWHLDVNGDAFTNLAAVAALTNLSNLEMNGIATPQNISFLSRLVNLNSLDLGNDHIGSLVALTNLTQMNNLYLNTDFLTDISPLLSFPNLGYVDVRVNLLDTNAAAAAWNVITNLQNNYVNVDYSPQNISPTLTVWDSPADDCIAIGDMAYFAVAASSTANTITYQWQFNGADLASQTNDILQIPGVGTNQAGAYRAIASDGNGFAASASARLYVGDTNCGHTVTIIQQPVNAVAAPGEDVTFSVVATTTLVNLYYQWLFNGTNVSGVNVSGETSNTLMLSSVNLSAVGIYQVLVWDNNSNVVVSVPVQLKVVDVVSFTDPNLSNLVVSALGFSPGTAVHLTDLDGLNYLYVNSQNISNISGLECARYLNTVDLGNNPINDASPLGWDSALQALYLNNCGLQDASFISGLTNLYNLDLSGNTIHSIPDMSGLAWNLGWLQINYNGPLIYSFRLSSLTNLYNLGLHDDGLPDIAFTAGMTQLESLDVGGDWLDDGNRNYIGDTSPLTGKTAMNWLSLSFNQVTNVPIVAAFTNLTTLYLSSNHFGNLNFITNLPNLNTLAINYSTVTNLDRLTNHTLLGYLDVGYIATTNLSYVRGLINLSQLWAGGNHAGGIGVVSNLISLQVLGFDQDGVRDLTPLTGLTSLYYLNLENNQITNASVISNRTALTSLYLAGNQIHDLTPLSRLTNMQWMSLGGNGFTNAAPLTNLHALVWLTMQSNFVQNVTPLAGLTNLYYALDLSANQISDMSPLTNLHKLTWLGMWQNQMKNLPSLVGLSNVTSLDFWGNQLTNASGVSGMTQLTWLSFNRNNFTVAPTLTGLPNLNSLDLSSNHISNVSSLAGLNSLNWLYLYANNLQSIHPLTSLTHLYYLDVHDNWLDITPGSAFMTDVATLNSYNTYVNYTPQNSLVLGQPAMAGPKHFSFNIYSPAGDVLQVSRSSDLSSWASLGTFTNTSGTNVFTDTNATSAKYFYRAQQ
jgi:internalin A